MMTFRAIVLGALGVMVMTLAGCGGTSAGPSIPSGPSGPPPPPPPPSPPVVTIQPLTPGSGNPVVIGVGVSGKDGYAFLDNAPSFGNSKLTMLAKDALGGSVGTAELPLLVTGWNDGDHKITLSKEQQALYEDRRTKSVAFAITVLCQLGTNPAQKITDQMTFTKP